MIYFYLAMGVAFTMFFISYYRNDGTTNEEGELYMAGLGLLIWPLMMLKFAWDMFLEWRKQGQKTFKNLKK